MPKHSKKENHPVSTAKKPKRDSVLSDRSVLDHIKQLPHAKATYKQLVRELQLQGENRDALEDVLDLLVEKGVLVELRSAPFAR